MPSIEPMNTKVFQLIRGVKHQLYPETIVGNVYLSDGSTLEKSIDEFSNVLSGKTHTYVVQNIEERDSLSNLIIGDEVRVKDATGDPSVKKGSAKYILDGLMVDGKATDLAWVKISEEESMDMIIEWDTIQNIPSSSVDKINTIGSVLGTMANHELTVHDNNGRLLLDGKVLGSTHRGYVEVDPESKDFDSAVTDLKLPNGAMFTVVTNKTLGVSPEAGFISVDSSDPNFEDDVMKLNLQDGSFLSSIEDAEPMERDTVHTRSAGYIVNVDPENEEEMKSTVESADIKNGAFFTIIDGDVVPMTSNASSDEKFVGYLYDVEPGTPEFMEALAQLNLSNGAMFGVISSAN